MECRVQLTAVMGRCLRFCLFVIALACAPASVGAVPAAEPVRIGVLAFRSKLQTLEQWQPLAAALQHAVPRRTFAVEALTFPEMDEAIAQKRLDFVLTNPGHYVLLTRRLGLTAPLATLAVDDNGRASTAFGGVIFTRSDRSNINTLQDIKGKTIAVVSTDSLGGFQMQTYELSRVGIRLPRDAGLIVTGMPQDNVIEAVLSGRADVGFVRTGVMEALDREDGMTLSRIRIINPQTHPGFELAVSTRLYPEWPFAAMPGTDANLARHVAAALFTLAENRSVTQAMGINGFVVPADYMPVADMLRELRMPPFDVAPSFTLADVWALYRWPLVGGGLALAVILALVLVLLRHRRQLMAAVATITESETFLRTLLDTLPLPVFFKDADGRYLGCNRKFEELLEMPREAIIGKTAADMAPAHISSVYRAQDAELFARAGTQTYEWVITKPSGEHRDVIFHKASFMARDGRIGGLVGAVLDITERMRTEERLRLAANVFTHAREGIVITDREARIVEVNQAFTDITGYTREDALGRNPRILKSNRQDTDFYATLWHDLRAKGHWDGEIWNRHKDGRIYAEQLTISAVYDDRGEIQNYIALFFDISRLKEQQAQLERMAHFDALTGLPNRLLLADRLKQAMRQASRRGQRVAVVYLDLDGFKAVNDTHGHELGDRLLIALAKRMSEALREGDTLARIGGDEFVAVLMDLPDIDSSTPILHRMLDAAAQPVRVDELELQVSASIGVSFYPQREEIDADQLTRQADQAMYKAKQSGKNRYQVFDAGQAHSE